MSVMTTASGFSFPNPPQAQMPSRKFVAVGLIALLLHAAAAAAIIWWPRNDVIEVPVRTLSVKLGPQTDWSGVEGISELEPLPTQEVSEVPVAPTPRAKPKVTRSKKTPPQTLAKPETPTSTQSNRDSAPKVTRPNNASASFSDQIVPLETSEPRKIPVFNRRHSRQNKVVVYKKPEPRQTSQQATQLPPGARRLTPQASTQTQQQQATPAVPNALSGFSPDAANAPRRLVRRDDAAAAMGDISDLSDKQIRQRYEMVISKWLEKHKQVPPLARQLGQHGKPVIRLRINRSGEVVFHALERRTGHELIDDAAMEMVSRADPFPAPPQGYPGYGVIEFLVPIQFNLQ